MCTAGTNAFCPQQREWTERLSTRTCESWCHRMESPFHQFRSVPQQCPLLISCLPPCAGFGSLERVLVLCQQCSVRDKALLGSQSYASCEHRAQPRRGSLGKVMSILAMSIALEQPAGVLSLAGSPAIHSSACILVVLGTPHVARSQLLTGNSGQGGALLQSCVADLAAEPQVPALPHRAQPEDS